MNTKPCKKCGALDRYSNGRCRPCRQAWEKKYRKKNPENVKKNQRKYSKENPEKVKKSQRKYGQKNREKKRESDCERYKKNPEKYRENHLKRNYGITIDEYNSLFEKQEGRCAIYKEKKPLHVDHCHKTDKDRGLLCVNCNTSLGGFQDNQDYLQSAIQYLQPFRI